MNIFKHYLFGSENRLTEVKLFSQALLKKPVALDTCGQLRFQKGFAHVPASQPYRSVSFTTLW